VKVLIVSTSVLPEYGGPAFSVSRLAIALAQAGANVGLWTSDQSVQSTPILPAECAVKRLAGTEIEAINRFGNPDLIHDNGIWLPHNHRIARLSVVRRIPRIVSTRGMLEPWALDYKKWKKRVAWNLYQRRDLKNAQYHHATAELEAKNLHAHGLGVPICVIPNGVEVPDADSAVIAVRREQKIALFLGRIHPIKGLSMLIEAWAAVRPDGWSLQIAGPDEKGYRGELAKAVSAFRLSDVVSFTGWLDTEQKQSALFRASVFVLPSYSESFGMAVAEALAHRLPVLTTTATPWSKLPEFGCGWMVEPTLEGLAEGVRRATSSDSEALRIMGERGKEFVAAEFGWDQIAGRFLTLYRKALSDATHI
jgi:glycosyltransferase involved in cell wall biosynthesis